jgi:hypothetical protein
MGVRKGRKGGRKKSKGGKKISMPVMQPPSGKKCTHPHVVTHSKFTMCVVCNQTWHNSVGPELVCVHCSKEIEKINIGAIDEHWTHKDGWTACGINTGTVAAHECPKKPKPLFEDALTPVVLTKAPTVPLPPVEGRKFRGAPNAKDV